MPGETIGQRVRRLRNAKGWGVVFVNNICGSAVSSVSPDIRSIENDEAPMTSWQQHALSKLFGVTPEYLLHGDPEPEPAVDWQAMYCNAVRDNAVLVAKMREDLDMWTGCFERQEKRDESVRAELATANERNAQLARELEETTGTMDHYRKRAIKAEHNENALRKQYEGGDAVKPMVGEPKSPFEGMQIGTTAPQPTVYPVDADTPDWPKLCPGCGRLSVKREEGPALVCQRKLKCGWGCAAKPHSNEHKARLDAFRAANAERDRQIGECRFAKEGDKDR